MSHIVRSRDQKRVSLETLYTTPAAPVGLEIALTIPSLRLIATFDDDAGTELDKTFCRTAPDDAAASKRQFSFQREGTFRIELRNGTQVWDWLRVKCATKLPASEKDLQAQGTGTINLQFLWTQDPGGNHPMRYYSLIAGMLLKQHGFSLDVKPAQDFVAGALLSFPKAMIAGAAGNLDEVQKLLAQRSEYTKKDRLVVVIGPLRQHTEEGQGENLRGEAIVQPEYSFATPPFVVIDSRKSSSDGATLLHEVCHVAGRHGHSDKDVNLMSYGPRRNTIDKEVIGYLGSVFFHS